VALGWVAGITAALSGQFEHLLLGHMAHLAEALEGGNVEVHGALGSVGVAPVQHHPDEAQDVVDGGAGRRLAYREHIQGGHVGPEAGRLLSR
jgi:hypothetical protein